MEVLAIILGSILLATGMWAVDGAKGEKHFIYQWEVKQMPNYKLVCRNREGVVIFTAENLTLEQAEEHVAMFNKNSEIDGLGNVWVVEPMRYH